MTALDIQNVNGFTWREALVDASIVSGTTFFSTVTGLSISGQTIQNCLLPSLISASSQFFLYLSIKRGLAPQKVVKVVTGGNSSS